MLNVAEAGTKARSASTFPSSASLTISTLRRLSVTRSASSETSFSLVQETGEPEKAGDAQASRIGQTDAKPTEADQRIHFSYSSI
jgi:hypothetical protein